MLPLIDIVFLLLVFFIYAMLSMAVHRGLELDLPESSTAEITKKTSLSISIRSGGAGLEIFVDKRPVPLSELHSHLKPDTTDSKKGNVLLFAEETVSYQQLYRVLDELKKAGISSISLQASVE